MPDQVVQADDVDDVDDEYCPVLHILVVEAEKRLGYIKIVTRNRCPLRVCTQASTGQS